MVFWKLTIDANDPAKLAQFWAQALSYQPRPSDEPDTTWHKHYRSRLGEDASFDDRLFNPAGLQPPIWFQQIPESKAGKNRLHLDLYPTGRDNSLSMDRRIEIVEAKVAELTRLGAIVERRDRNDDPEDLAYYAVMHDPEGNEFCVAIRQKRGAVAEMIPLVGLECEAGFHADFTLSVTKALRDQLDIALNGLTRAPLTMENLNRLHERSGVYQLYLHDELVYVGKADKTLPGRLKKHRRKISGRENIELSDVNFCCLYVDEDFTALAPEKLLISRYDQTDRAMWNHNGFGNNDPGRNRDRSLVKSNHFDRAYPAALQRTVDGLSAGDIRMNDLLQRLKSGLPFNFRYGKGLGPAANEVVKIETAELTADQAFNLIARNLPPKWQIVAFPGYSIMYPDSPTAYLSARRYYRGSERIDAEPQFEAADDIEETDEESTEE